MYKLIIKIFLIICIFVVLYFNPIPVACFCDNPPFFTRCIANSQIDKETCDNIKDIIDSIDESIMVVEKQVTAITKNLSQTIPPMPDINKIADIVKQAYSNYIITDIPTIPNINLQSCSITIPISKIIDETNSSLTKINDSLNNLTNDMNKSQFISDFNNFISKLKKLKNDIDAIKISNPINDIGSLIKNFILNFLNNINDSINNLLNDIKNLSLDQVTALVSKIDGLITQADTIITKISDQDVTSEYNSIISTANRVKTVINDIIKALNIINSLNDIYNEVNKIINNFSSLSIDNLKEIPNKINNYINQATNYYNTVKDLNIDSTIKNNVTQKYNEVNNFANNFKNSLNTKLSCDSGYTLKGLICIKNPPESYKFVDPDIKNYWLDETITYLAGDAKNANQDNSACNDLTAVVNGVGFCTGTDPCKTRTPNVCTPNCWRVCSPKVCALGKCLGGNCYEKCGDQICTGNVCVPLTGITRNAPRSCPNGTEFDDDKLLCYPVCKQGYSKKLLFCVNNKAISKPINDIKLPTLKYQ